MSDINENNELGYTDNEDNYSDFESTRTITSVIDTETGEEITVTDEFFKQDEARLILLRRRQHEAAYLDIGTPKYICSFCKKPVVLLGRKTNRGRVCFFAHFKDSDDCPIKTKMNLSKREIEAFKYKGQTESERHKELKGFLVNALEFSTYRGNPFVNIQEEKYIKSESPFFTWARPDVYSETGDKRINFEIQLSTTFLSVLITRDIFYRYHNIFILWIFNFDENQAYMDESSLMTKDIFYGNNGNMFILDETAKKLTEKNKELTFLCKWIEPEQKNGKNQNVVKNQYISISELTFDEKTHTVYFFDSISAIGKYDSTIFQIRKEIESGRLEFIDLLRSYMDGEIPTQEEVIERVKEGIYNPVWLKKGNKYGWAKFGHIIIPFIYTDARPFTNGYATVRRNRLYGIVDILGNEIVPCEYREIGTFVRGKAKVKKNGKYGYINENGEIIIPFEYDDIGKFVDGKAKTMQLYYGHCKYGYISENGTIIAPVKYDEISEFENGKAKVKIYRSCKHYQYGYINEKGLEIIPPYYNEIEEFVDGIAKAQRNGHGGRVDDKGNEIVENEIQITNQLIKGETFGEWGIRDLNGKIIVPYEYDEINDFIDGRAKAKKNGKYGYINENGEIIIPFEYDIIDDFTDGRAEAKKNGKYGYINENGEIIIPFEYDIIDEFIDGRAKVKKNGKYGYINENGEIIIPVEYDEINDFTDGRAKAKKNWKYGYINENGEIIIPFEYDAIGTFIRGKAKVKKNGKYGYINEKGLEIIPPYYDEIEEFVDDIAKAQRNGHGGRVDGKGNEIVENEIQITNQLIKGETFGEWGIRDLNGKIIVPYEYDEINDFIDGRAKAKKYNKYGYINENGEIIIPIEYDEIGEFVNKRAKVKKDGKYGYIDEQRNILIPCDYSYIYNFANGIAKVIKDGKYGYIDEQGSIIVSCDYQGRRIKNFKIG